MIDAKRTSSANIESQHSPINHILNSVVQLLDVVKYEARDGQRADRIKLLQQTYLAATDRFAQKRKHAKHVKL